MTHVVRVLITLVQVGSHLWVNPDQVAAVREEHTFVGSLGRVSPVVWTAEVCVAGQADCMHSDWDTKRVLEALDPDLKYQGK